MDSEIFHTLVGISLIGTAILIVFIILYCDVWGEKNK